MTYRIRRSDAPLAGASSRGYQVGPDTVVQLHYRAFDEEGELVAESERPAEFLVGYGQLPSRLEREVEGLTAGQSRSVTLGPSDAFGPRDSRAVLEVDRMDFPQDLAPGDQFEAEGASGELVWLRVLEASSETVVVDTNHPLAGQKVRFEITIDAVRPATEEERTGATERLQAVQAPTLVSVDRLLQGGGRRYESTPAQERSKQNAEAPGLAPPLSETKE
ncbi:MAG: peptidylprolyl isomerase [Polyangiaceae bacterium]|nr:peptidylprolyl isomerase [Polyangiaceae bacterium]